MESHQEKTIKYLRDTGRKQVWLAKQLDISPSLLSAWLAGKVRFPKSRLMQLLEIINAG